MKHTTETEQNKMFDGIAEMWIQWRFYKSQETARFLISMDMHKNGESLGTNTSMENTHNKCLWESAESRLSKGTTGTLSTTELSLESGAQVTDS